MTAQIADWKRRFPCLLHVETLGKTVEGHPIPLLRLSSRKRVGSEPGVLIVAGIHPRESQPMHVVLWLVDELLTQYGRDDRVTQLLDTRQIYVVPVLNGDGKRYDETGNAPGFDWRKNRRRAASGAIGVDLNRNFPVRWGGFREQDATWRDRVTNPLGNIYEGNAPLSEPESAALAAFLWRKRESLRLFVDVHSPLRKILTPVYVFGADAARYKTLTDGIRARQKDTPYDTTVIKQGDEPTPGVRPGNTGLSYPFAYHVCGVYGMNIEIGLHGAGTAGRESVDGDTDLRTKHYPPTESIRAEYEANIREPLLFLLDAAGDLPRQSAGNVRVTASRTDVAATPGATISWTPTLSGNAAYAVLTCDSPAVVVQSEVRRVPVTTGFTLQIAPNAKPGTVAKLRLTVWDNERRVSHCPVLLVVAPK